MDQTRLVRSRMTEQLPSRICLVGKDQLRELMETELGAEEDLITKKKIEEADQDQDKVFALPDLSEFIDNNSGDVTPEMEAAEVARNAKRIDRSNQEEYMRVMQLNPFADADDTMFTRSTIFSEHLRQWQVARYSCRTCRQDTILIICVLAGNIYAPGNLNRVPSRDPQLY